MFATSHVTRLGQAGAGLSDKYAAELEVAISNIKDQTLAPIWGYNRQPPNLTLTIDTARHGKIEYSLSLRDNRPIITRSEWRDKDYRAPLVIEQLTVTPKLRTAIANLASIIPTNGANILSTLQSKLYT